MNCDLAVMIDHLDHVCQLAGNADHIGIGSDLDGAFGREQAPYDLETIADLSSLPGLLAKRGYPSADIDKVMKRTERRPANLSVGDLEDVVADEFGDA